jgi:hypothetical protein
VRKRAEAFSNRQLGTAERFASLTSRLVIPLVDAVAGSDSEAYVQLSWQTLRQPVVEVPPHVWVCRPGDPETGRFPRNHIPRLSWNRSVVIGLKASAIDTMQATRTETLLPAAAYAVGEVVHVALLPEDRGFAEIPFRSELLRGMALRRGCGSFKSVLGAWSEYEQQLIVPDEQVVVDEAALNTSLAERYPGIVLS